MGVQRIPRDAGDSFAGVGIYSIAEASRLTGISRARLRGWIVGHPNSAAEPIIRRQLPPIGERLAMGFLDLMEARFIDRFVDKGVSIRAIRLAAQRARDRLQCDHPFATDIRYRTDRKTIFEEVQKETRDRELLDLIRNQFALYDVVEETLDKDIEFDNNIAALWTPNPVYPDVIVDPTRCFGRPHLRAYRLPTREVFRTYKISGDYKETADWCDISVEHAKEAVHFEMELPGREISS